jgi:ABC-type phosphate transport system substrate-binding protein
MTPNLGIPARATITWLLLSGAGAAAEPPPRPRAQPSRTAPAVEGYTVVINPANPVASLRRGELADLFLRRKSRWPDESAVLAVDGPDSPARESFSKDVLGKKTAAVRSYWLQVIFSGRGVPPPEKPSDAEVIAFVKAHPAAIGYVSAAVAPDDVKVLRVEP